MSKKKLARIIGVCTAAIIIVGAITVLPSCQEQTPTPPTYGLQFDGVDDYVSLGNATALGFTSQDFTIEAWIKPAITTKPMQMFHRHKWNEDGYRLQVSSPGALSFFTFQSGANQVSRTSNGTVTVGDWYHVAVVRQGASVRIYVNGVDKTVTAGSHIDPAYNAKTLTFMGTSYEPEAFAGIISEVRVWNRARTKSEIKANMSKELTGGEEGLVGYWKLNEGSGTIAHDTSPSANNGRIYGNPVWLVGGG